MRANDTGLLEVSGLCVRVPGRRLVEALEMTLNRGEFVAVLGRNGTGKTLSLLTLAGLRQPDGGAIRLGNEAITSLGRQQVARRLALLPQDTDDIFPATVLDTALVGRHPHIGRFRWESQRDYDLARESLAMVGIGDLADRDVLSLSGGERRRLAIAQVLTQSPDVYLLDEPTNHLDPQHQVDTLRIFRRIADDGAGVVASLHDINLAARVADRCLLLFGDGRWEFGTTDEVLDEERLEAVFETPMEAVSWRDRRLFVAGGSRP
ncbi:MAG: ATP-binding cassette domain-containing protein [Gammaproteobacteria bacterium]|jgi:iron complex transport system ATP-binding protein|nr:ATP-binding cassette domain-containing protein [Gammaproteobacteria bacterium]